MLYTNLTKRAMEICFKAHRSQKDKGGQAYVFHPFHLAEQMETEEEICTALLHDVVEDTGWELEQLRAEGFPERVVEALTLLTHDPAVPYLDYVRNLRDHPIAAKVKLADLRHNSTAGRLKPAQDGEAEKRNVERMKKYLRAQAILTGGSADLDAMELVLARDLTPSAGPETGPGGAEGSGGPDGTAAGEIRLRTVLSPEGRVRRYVTDRAKGRERVFSNKADLFEYLLQCGIPARDILEALRMK